MHQQPHTWPAGLVEELGIDAELLAVSSLRRMDGGLRPVLQGPSWQLLAASCPDLTPGADAGSSVTRCTQSHLLGLCCLKTCRS